MSKATYWQRGESLDYVNSGSTAIEANTVIAMVGRIGIAGMTINPGAKGDIHVCGVFEFTKTGTSAVKMGQTVYFDGTGITDSADNGKTSTEKVAYTPAGFAVAATEAVDTAILVKIG